MEWRHKVVRDLAWAVGSPHLLDTPEAFPDAEAAAAAKAAAPWLAELDADPSPLLHFIRTPDPRNPTPF